MILWMKINVQSLAGCEKVDPSQKQIVVKIMFTELHVLIQFILEKRKSNSRDRLCTTLIMSGPRRYEEQRRL